MPRASRPFDPSDRAAAERRLRAKFDDTDFSILLDAAVRFVENETTEPFNRYLNDPRRKSVELAIGKLRDAIEKLPDDLRLAFFQMPRPEMHSRSLFDLDHVLAQWESVLGVDDEATSEDFRSVLSARDVRARFAAEVGLGVSSALDEWPGAVTGNDLTYLAIVSRLETHDSTTESDAVRSIHDTWKKALDRARELVDEALADSPSTRRRRVARPRR